MSTENKTNNINVSDLFLIDGLDSYRGIFKYPKIKAAADKVFEDTNDLRAVDNYCKQVLNKPYNDELLNESKIPKRYQGCSLNNYEAYDDVRKEAKRKVQEYLDHMDDNFKGGINLLLAGYGKTDTGKTHIACAIANKTIEKRVPVKFINVTSMLAKIRENFNISEFAKADLLVIDDLGKEKQTDWVMEQLYSITNYRYDDMKPNIITTELSPAKLKQRYGDAVFRRITSPYVLIKLNCDRYSMRNMKEKQPRYD